MPQSIQDVMTPDPLTVDGSATARDVAQLMRDNDVGDVIVTAGGEVRGIVTDRDIVVRAVAEQPDPAAVQVQDICSSHLAQLRPSDTVEAAVATMEERAVRRVPVVEDGRPVGIVSLGDLAIERDPDSALANISAAPPNA
jgi:CBS domain-containing protein